MRLLWRAVLVLVVFAAVGWVTGRAVIAHVVRHSVANRAPLPEVRLSGALAGLSAGSAAALIVGIAMLRRR